MARKADRKKKHRARAAPSRGKEKGPGAFRSDAVAEIPGPLTVGMLYLRVRALITELGRPLAAVVLLVELPLIVLLLSGDPTHGVAPMLYGLIALIGSAAAIHLALQHHRREKRSLGRALKTAVSCYIGLIAALLFSQLMVMAFALLLIVPGVMRAVGYALIPPLIVSGDSYGIDALGESLRWMKGYRMTAFKAFVLAWLPAIAWQALYGAIFGFDRLLGGEAGDLSAGMRTVDTLFHGLYPVVELPVTLLQVALYWEIRGRRSTPA